MKAKVLYLTSIIIFLFSCSNSTDIDGSKLDKETYSKVKWVLNELSISKNARVYIQETTIPPNSWVELYGFSSYIHRSPDYESLLIFLDEEPSKKWPHNSKLVLISTTSYNYDTYDMHHPLDRLPTLIRLR